MRQKICMSNIAFGIYAAMLIMIVLKTLFSMEKQYFHQERLYEKWSECDIYKTYGWHENQDKCLREVNSLLVDWEDDI